MHRVILVTLFGKLLTTVAILSGGGAGASNASMARLLWVLCCVFRTDACQRLGGRMLIHDAGGARRQSPHSADDSALATSRFRPWLRSRHRRRHHQRIR